MLHICLYLYNHIRYHLRVLSIACRKQLHGLCYTYGGFICRNEICPPVGVQLTRDHSRVRKVGGSFRRGERSGLCGPMEQFELEQE